MTSYSPITPEIVNHIQAIFRSKHLIDDSEKLEMFSKDASEEKYVPDLLVEATSAEQVQILMRLANQFSFPVTPRGSGMGVAGVTLPLLAGVVLSLAKMNRILVIEKENLIAVVEPGVINLDLKNAVRDVDLFYPPDPASLDTSSRTFTGEHSYSEGN